MYRTQSLFYAFAISNVFYIKMDDAPYFKIFFFNLFYNHAENTKIQIVSLT